MTGNRRSVGSGGAGFKFIGLMSCLFALCLTGCYQPNPRVDRQQIESMANPEAYLLSLLDQRYINPDVHCELGRYYHSQHQDTKALHHYQTALGFDPAHRPTQAAMIKLYLDQGKMSQAQELMQRYQRQIGSSPQQLVELGDALEGEGLDNYALSCYQQALKLGPDLAPTNKYLGLYYLKHNDLDQAKQYLKRSFDINPNQPDVAKHLGELGVTVQVPTDYGTGITTAQ